MLLRDGLGVILKGGEMGEGRWGAEVEEGEEGEEAGEAASE
jgi:hypothetical protein